MKPGTVALLGIIALLIATPAYAYVDPGTGSMLVQFLTGGVAGALVLVRLYWRRLREKVTGKSAKAEAAQQAKTASHNPR